MYRLTPYLVRTLLTLLLFVYDWLMKHYFSKPNMDIVTTLKDITVYNATLLSLFLCISFIFKGEVFKIEELVKYMNGSICSIIFYHYYPKSEMSKSTSDYYQEDIDKRNYRILEIESELKELPTKP